MMKKIIPVITSVLLAVCLCACGTADVAEDDGRINVVCTIFPQYDFVREIAGDYANIKLLVSAGADVHGYEPSLTDLKAVNECDLFIYCSGESESWVDDLLNSVGGKALDIRKGLTLIAEDDFDDDHEGHNHNSNVVFDEHVWTSPEYAMDIVENITDELVKCVPEYADEIRSNSDKYIAKLDALDKRFENIFSEADEAILIFADRFPFRYFAEEYGVDYYAAFLGCSSETEAPLSTINNLVKSVKDSGVMTVFYVEMSDQSTADIVCKQTGCGKALLHSCHNLSKAEFESGMTYLKLMNINADTLEEALIQ